MGRIKMDNLESNVRQGLTHWFSERAYEYILNSPEIIGKFQKTDGLLELLHSEIWDELSGYGLDKGALYVKAMEPSERLVSKLTLIAKSDGIAHALDDMTITEAMLAEFPDYDSYHGKLENIAQLHKSEDEPGKNLPEPYPELAALISFVQSPLMLQARVASIYGPQ